MEEREFGCGVRLLPVPPHSSAFLRIPPHSSAFICGSNCFLKVQKLDNARSMRATVVSFPNTSSK
jgi:hypothetical protein